MPKVGIRLDDATGKVYRGFAGDIHQGRARRVHSQQEQRLVVDGGQQ